MNILCATDDNYVPWCGIMLTSLLENNANVRIFVITEGLSDVNLKTFKKLENKYNCEINEIVVSNDSFKNCPIRPGDHVSLAAYYRLALADLLPEDIERIIYLDCDIIVNQNLNELWEENIDEYAVGAVIDETYFEEEPYIRLGIKSHGEYINSGVLFINLKYWRENDITSQCFKCINDISEKLLFHDQDTLNVVLENKIKFLPLNYNLQTGFLFTVPPFEDEIKAKILDAVKSPSIIHFTGYNKPWIFGSKTPFVPYFLHYKGLSLWNDTPLIHIKPSFKETIRNIVYECVWKLGIKKRPQSYIIPMQYPK